MVLKVIGEFPGKGWTVSGLKKIVNKIEKHWQYKNALRKRTTSHCTHWLQRWFCKWIDFESGKCTKESQNHTANFI